MGQMRGSDQGGFLYLLGVYDRDEGCQSDDLPEGDAEERHQGRRDG
jgi:hypothetical protein